MNDMIDIKKAQARPVGDEVKLSCRLFNKTGFSRGRLVEFSENGLCFDTDAAYTSGQVLQILVEKFPSTDAPPAKTQGLRANSLARVVWRRPERCTGERPFRVWAEYCR